MARILCTLALGAILAACATLNEGDCRYADWFELGRRDGLQGRSWQQLVRHRDSCVEYGVSVDETRYRTGRNVGLRDYCTPQSGWGVGLGGRDYRGVCPEAMEAGFLDGYELGREVSRLRPDIARYKREAERREETLAEEELDPRARRELLHQLHELIEMRVEAERHLAHLEAAAHERGFLP